MSKESLPEYQPLTIGDAEELAIKREQDIVIVIGIAKPGKLSICSWGRDKNLCAIGGAIADGLFNALQRFWSKLAADHIIKTSEKKGGDGNG